ncbi:MAG: hypothetical protein KC619_33120 [Myxococcales bacterium]|nr:hypothetical protein [Myxococcales bacterium]
MAYRDDLETRRAHVARLEDELAALEREEALVRSLPGERGLIDKLLGGPRKLTRRFVCDVPLEAIAEHARDVFEIDGRVEESRDYLVWKGEPEPRPRRVEVHATRNAEGRVEVEIIDQGSYRAYLVLLALSGVLTNALSAEVWALALLVVGLGLLFAVRRGIERTTRRRARQAIALEEALSAVAPAPRVRVAEEAEMAEVEIPESRMAEARR